MADNPGTLAVADRDPHMPGSTHSHVGTRTNCSTLAAGEVRIAGAANANSRYAPSANARGVGPPPAANAREIRLFGGLA